MLQGGYMEVMQARTPEALLSQLVRFAQRLEFETVSATVVIDHLSEETEFFCVDNTPPAYRSFFEDIECARQDPVMQHCKKSNLPIAWEQTTYTAAGKGALWERQACHGYCNGIAVAMHFPDGRHFFLGVDRDKSLPNNPAQVLRMVADLQLFTTCAQEAAMRIFAPEAEIAVTPVLTSSELDTLRWTMEGKTAWEVGDVLGISERTTVMHLNLAMRKLGCVSKHQAVLKALRIGLFR